MPQSLLLQQKASALPLGQRVLSWFRYETCGVRLRSLLHRSTSSVDGGASHTKYFPTAGRLGNCVKWLQNLAAPGGATETQGIQKGMIL